MLEPQLVGRVLERLEFVWMPVADDRQMILGRSEVLADGEHLDTVIAKRAERVDHLIERLAETDHQSRFGHDLISAQFLGAQQHAA